MSAPPPLVPAEVDLQDFAFMPLHVARLRDSNLAAEEDPEACWYAVLLWAASWHQIPAGSLPDADAVLMRLVGLGRDQRTWKKHRAGALRGFVLCDDGRLYHPVVAESALDAWKGKLQQRHRTYCAAVRKHNQRHPDDQREIIDFDQWEALNRPTAVTRLSHETGSESPIGQGDLSHETPPPNECDIVSKGERKGQGQGQGQGDSNIEPLHAWAGKTIRLNAADLAKWEGVYHALPDIRGELASLDDWLQGQPEDVRKRWFHVVSGSLNKKHQAALREARNIGEGARPIC